MSQTRIPLGGFKECDIRGELGTDITGEFAYMLGRALGTLTPGPAVITGGDFRLSTPELLGALGRGIRASGKDVIALGQLTTPAFYFARRHLGITTGVMVTASHNPASWNGFKVIIGAYPITPEELDALKRLMLAGEFAAGSGTRRTVDIRADYIAWLVERFAGLKRGAPAMVFDCGNGATGWVAQEVIDALNLAAPCVLLEPDGHFPNRSPDIAGPGDLALLEREVVARGAALGAGFDGDGDRVGIVDHTGSRVPSDLLIAWLAGELVRQRGGGTVICDLKLSDAVADTVRAHGGTIVPQKSGHTFIKTAMLEHDAVFGGEYSGHLFFRELNGDDDALYAALLIAGLVQQAGKPLAELLADIPRYHSTPDIRIPYAGDRQAAIERAASNARAAGDDLLQLDGVKVHYADGWALMRASVTEPALTFRFEGRAPQATRQVAARFLHGLDDIKAAIWPEIEQHTAPPA